MSKTRYEFESARRIEPDAVGEPGNRRFRLLVEDSHRSACLWLEKEQLQALGLAIDQLLSPLSVLWSREAPPKPKISRPVGFPDSPTIELEVGRLALGSDEAAREFVLFVHDADSDQEGPATLTCPATRVQMRDLSRAIATLVSAGRPRCPLCGQPVESERHLCPSAN
jgi:uncharacterized repeat protein (TIGR03847 family)